jgi:hypothetical protein
MEDNLNELIQRKIMSVEYITIEAKTLTDKAKSLPKEARKNIPACVGDWSEESMQRFFGEFKESIINPIRHRNRDLLENIGLKTKGIPEEVFDDSTGIEKVVSLSNAVKEFSENILKIIMEKNVLFEWIRAGLDAASQNLNNIIVIQKSLKEIAESNLSQILRNDLLQRSVIDRGFINTAEDVLSKVRFVSGFGITLESIDSFEVLKSSLAGVCQKLVDMQTKYLIPKNEILELTERKSLFETDSLLKKKLEEYAKKERALREEWKMYSATLKSIGHITTTMPEGIHELEESVRKLKGECMDALGEEGVSILTFLKGEGNFPDNIPIEKIKKSLEVLRPVFMNFLREEN